MKAIEYCNAREEKSLKLSSEHIIWLQQPHLYVCMALAKRQVDKLVIAQ